MASPSAVSTTIGTLGADNPASHKILLPGGAGLVGQNLIVHLKKAGYKNLVALDKHPTNLAILRQLHPDITAELVDLATPGPWSAHFAGAAAVVMLQAQIGHTEAAPFFRNNVTATKIILECIQQHAVPYTIHISSSVVESVAADPYTNTKREQEELVRASGTPAVILRPTLMFGWFDRKHLGWLARFMKKSPVFPIPGDGKFSRQPLYAGDFCKIIVSCLNRRPERSTYNISGREKIYYIDIIRSIRRATSARCTLLKIPVGLFSALLRIWAVFDEDPPFTADQLTALIANEEFEVIDWPHIFDVSATPFNRAIDEAFNNRVYGKIVLDF